tara:strand:+ start:10981 stop:12012 length:1032 start_codon:yes stop_codon:yes gene_type:complete
MDLQSTNILITGGTGSFGKHFLKKLLTRYPNLERVVIYSRDELKQWELQQQYPREQYPNLRFFLGDIRDIKRLKHALEKIDVVIHAAALKQVTAAEYNPIEFIKTNIIGSENIVNACMETDVKKVIALSTDKAAAPINVYGATKLVSDKLFIAGNNIKGNRKLSFSCVRYGNVMGSRGSVIPLFLEKAPTGTLPITDPNMTRFNITLDQAADMVFWVLKHSLGGEIFVPKIPSYLITDLAEAIGPKCTQKVIGVRNGEKIHEEMITAADSYNTFDLGNYYAILQPSNEISRSSYRDHFKSFNLEFNQMEVGTSYNSKDNNHYLTIDEIRDLIKTNLLKEFQKI